MPLNKRLRHIIDTKKIKETEIAKKCKELGTPIDKSYITKLLNNDIKIPDEKKLETIAQVLGVNKRLLVLENFFDNAPKEIINIFKLLLSISATSANPVYSDILKINTLEEASKYINDTALADFALELTDAKKEDFIIDKDSIKIKNEEDGYTVQLYNTKSIPIPDNSIKFFPKGEKVSFKAQLQYRDGDLIIFKHQNTKQKYLIRYYFELDDGILLKATNPMYKPIKCKLEDISILGKVVELITKIQ